MSLQEGLVSVIMSNYNTQEEYLRLAIESVLNQTYKNFEFIIVDDCSEKKSLEIIKSYNDPRIILMKNNQNMGITKSLNKALKRAKGEFVARMDADDFCMKTRLEKQVDFLTVNKEIIVCGTWVELFGEGAVKFNDKYSCKTIPDREQFQIQLLFGNHTNIIHPTAMFRHETLLKHDITYNENYIYAQDYRMWIECSKYGECSNVPEILLKYRIHNDAVSSSKNNIQKLCTENIIKEQLSWLHLKLPENWEKIHFAYLTGRKEYDLCQKKWIMQLIENNKKYHVFNQKKLEDTLWRKWAETSYFVIAKERDFLKIIEVFKNIPFKYWIVLFVLKKERIKSD